MTDRLPIYSAINAERRRQQIKWEQAHEWGKGDCSSPDVAATTKLVVLAEECGEVARAVLDRDDTALQTELIQVAAIAVAWLEHLQSNQQGATQ
jgi:NTP pyrophosphatase (non-canonical NTP hydrolase)